MKSKSYVLRMFGRMREVALRAAPLSYRERAAFDRAKAKEMQKAEARRVS